MLFKVILGLSFQKISFQREYPVYLIVYSETAICGNLEAVKVKNFSRSAPTVVALREIRPPPPKFRNVPTPQVPKYCIC